MVMRLLLKANSQNATLLDKARCCARTAALSDVLERLAARGGVNILRRSHATTAQQFTAPRASYTQDEKLPLHYAAAKGAPLDVSRLLLDANLKAAASKDKARS